MSRCPYCGSEVVAVKCVITDMTQTSVVKYEGKCRAHEDHTGPLCNTEEEAVFAFCNPQYLSRGCWISLEDARLIEEIASADGYDDLIHLEAVDRLSEALDARAEWALTTASKKSNACKPTLSSIVDIDLSKCYANMAKGITRNGMSVTAEDIKSWDISGKVPEECMWHFCACLNLPEDLCKLVEEASANGN